MDIMESKEAAGDYVGQFFWSIHSITNREKLRDYCGTFLIEAAKKPGNIYVQMAPTPTIWGTLNVVNVIICRYPKLYRTTSF